MKTAVVICPGRGTYNKPELGVLRRRFPNPKLLAVFDARRVEEGQDTLSALDGADRFSAAVHTRGDNASGLIFAASYGDFLSLDRQAIEVVAVTGNSMGWYTALVCGGALEPGTGFEVVNTMGRLMHEHGRGGQVVYPHVAEDWLPDPARRQKLLSLVSEIDLRAGHTLTVSIDLGGMLVMAGDETGLTAFETAVPRRDRFPMRLPNHAGFHSPLVSVVSEMARARFAPGLFAQPDLPMIDGRGAIWWPGAADPEKLFHYTFGHQITHTYDFTHAIRIAAREFAPDYFIVTGPGTTLGGVVAQSLVLSDWRGMGSRAEFQALQEQSPLLVSMGRDDQRGLVALER